MLRALVEYFEDPTEDGVGIRIPELSLQCGLPQPDVVKALRALDLARPRYLDGIRVGELSYPVIITRITERALRAVGQWPASDNAADAIIAAFNEAAEAEPDEEKRSALRRTGTFLAGAGREVLYRVITGVASGEISQHIPPHI